MGHKSNKFYKQCKKRGHLVDECSLKNEKEKEEKSKQPQKSIVASVVDSESDGDVLCDNRCVVEWILDSDCTYHICPRTDWFSTYKPLDSRVVLVAMMLNVTWLVLAPFELKSMMVFLGPWQMVVIFQIWSTTIFHLLLLGQMVKVLS